MTNHTVRLYALAVSILVFFVAWAAIAARPWATTKSASADPRIAALAAKEQRVRAEAVAVRRVLAARAKASPLASSSAAPQPSVKVVTLPPLTITRTS